MNPARTSLIDLFDFNNTEECLFFQDVPEPSHGKDVYISVIADPFGCWSTTSDHMVLLCRPILRDVDRLEQLVCHLLLLRANWV
jgi:hypothetical protein